jgi:hypothetical protein
MTTKVRVPCKKEELQVIFPVGYEWKRQKEDVATIRSTDMMYQVLSDCCGNYAELGWDLGNTLPNDPSNPPWQTYRIETHCVEWLFVGRFRTIEGRETKWFEVHSIWAADN